MTWRGKFHASNQKMIFPVFLFLFGFTPSAQAVTLEELIAQVQNTYAQLNDLQADFTQETAFEGFSTTHRLDGILYLKKPTKMRWDYRTPSQQQIFLEGEKFTYYIPEHQQVVISSLTQETAQEIPIHLLASLSTLQRDYTVTWKEEPTGEPLSYQLRLHPKRTQETSHVIVAINPKSHFIEKMEVASLNGNRSSFSFSNIKVNQGISDSLFNFSVPKGVEIVSPPKLN
ncbi:MAG TPA: outer membrane lipoprotein carrier protein LolA [Nitrospiria bacterium]